jgi:hypothetical protein
MALSIESDTASKAYSKKEFENLLRRIAKSSRRRVRFQWFARMVSRIAAYRRRKLSRHERSVMR